MEDEKQTEVQTGQQKEYKLSVKTARDYQNRLRTMERAAFKKRWKGVEGDYPSIRDEDLVTDLLENDNQLRFNTLRRRRDALVLFFRGRSSSYMIDEITSSDFTNKLREVAFPDKSPTPSPNKSRSSKRTIPESDYKQLTDTIAKMKKPTRIALIFLQATVATGARPIEWTNAVWEDRLQGKLRLKNAKQKIRNGLNGKSCVPNVVFKEGGEPTFRIIHVDPQDIEVVDKHVLSVRSCLINNEFGIDLDLMDDEMRAQVFGKYYDRCRTVIFRACKKLFPDGRLYSLYDARNVFAANRRARDGMKAAAAQLGHNAEKLDSNIAAYYGNRHMAWPGYKHSSVKPQAKQEQIEKADQIPVSFNIPSFNPQ